MLVLTSFFQMRCFTKIMRHQLNRQLKDLMSKDCDIFVTTLRERQQNPQNPAPDDVSYIGGSGRWRHSKNSGETFNKNSTF